MKNNRKSQNSDGIFENPLFSPIPFAGKIVKTEHFDNKDISLRLFSAQSPINPINENPKIKSFARPRTSQLKMRLFTRNDDPENVIFEEMPNKPPFFKEISKKSNKSSPFQAISQYTTTQNENYIEKLRVLSAISRKSEDLLFQSEKTEVCEIDEEKFIEKDESFCDINDNENQIFGNFKNLLLFFKKLA